MPGTTKESEYARERKDLLAKLLAGAAVLIDTGKLSTELGGASQGPKGLGRFGIAYLTDLQPPLMTKLQGGLLLWLSKDKKGRDYQINVRGWLVSNDTH